jgi:hypothetical protein
LLRGINLGSSGIPKHADEVILENNRLTAPVAILLVAGLGALLHFLVIEPLLSAPPINQLLATGGVLFFLQSFATVAFGIDFRNLGIRLPVLALGEMHFSYSRLLSFAAALIGMMARNTSADLTVLGLIGERGREVKDFLEQQTRMPEFLNSVYDLIDISVEDYIKRGFESLMINFGCTGGQHRSVYAADALARHLRNKFKVKIDLKHTEQEKKNWVNE